jgi:hypothetical protein
MSFEIGRTIIEVNDVVQEKATCNKISMFNYVCAIQIIDKEIMFIFISSLYIVDL